MFPHRIERQPVVLAAVVFSIMAACGTPEETVSAGETDAPGAAADIVLPECLSDWDCPQDADPCTRNRCSASGCNVATLSLSPCDDGDPCTVADRCQDGACSPGADQCECRANADCKLMEDGDLCNGSLICNQDKLPWRCVLNPASIVTCADKADTVCAWQACDPNDGQCKAVHAPAGTPCTDGDACTPESSCEAGQCKSVGASLCACAVQADCDAFDDGNACNGAYICDTQQFPWGCKINPSTVVDCAASKDPCMVRACVPKTGQCALSPAPDGGTCDDGDPSTTGDSCQAGKCKAGTDTAKCSKDADCIDDGNLCNGLLYCDQKAGACTVNQASVIVCPAGADSACLKNTCQPASAECQMQAAPAGSKCDDGAPCTEGDLCVGATCKGGQNTCVCKSDADCVGKDDGSLCDGAVFCNQANGVCEENPASAVQCPTVDDGQCLKSACIPATGKCEMKAAELLVQKCVKTGKGGEICNLVPLAGGQAKATPCDDGDGCTTSDHCEAGACEAGTFICTCNSDADCVDKDDGDLCNGTQYCDKNADPPACKHNPASVVSCKTVDDTECRKNSCIAKTGECVLMPVLDGTICSDGNACTKGDFCYGGGCKSGATECECQSNFDCLAKDDGDFCNGVPYCDKSKPESPVCKDNPGSKVFCPDVQAGPCLSNSCDAKTGDCKLTPLADGKACKDGDDCSTAEACKAGKCVGKVVDCDDNDACTQDACTVSGGCTHKAANCDDGNSCTADLCDSKTGKCVAEVKTTDGKSCDADSDGCTVGDTCKGGKCLAGGPVLCDTSTGPCEKPVCVSTGPISHKCVAGIKADGASCDGAEGCLLGSTCKSGKCLPGDKPKLFEKQYPAAGQRQGAQTAAVWSDGGLLLAGARHTWAAGAEMPTASAWWLARTDVLGAVTWESKLDSDPGVEVGVNGAAVLIDGSAMVVGTVVPKGGKPRAHLLHLGGADGKTKWGATLAAADESRGLAVAVDENGAAAAVGSLRTSPTAVHGQLWRVSAGGVLQWQNTVGGVADRRLNAVAVYPGGQVMAAGQGRVDDKGIWKGQVTRISGTGKTLWDKDLPATGGALIAGMAAVGSDAVLAGHVFDSDGKRHGWTLRVDAAGDVKWQRQTAAGLAARSIAALPTGELLVGGEMDTAGGKADLWLMAADSEGFLLWDRSLAGLGAESAGAVAAVGSTGLALVGSTMAAADGAESAAMVVRADVWGHTSCALAGTCVAKALADCGDSNPCTLDGCHATKGCTHPTVDDVPCEAGGTCFTSGTCKAGKCVGAANGRLFARNQWPDPLTPGNLRGLAVVGANQLMAWDSTLVDKVGKYHAYGFDGYGNRTWTTEDKWPGVPTYWAAGDGFTDLDGSVVTLWSGHFTGGSITGWKSVIRRYSPQGKPEPARTLSIGGVGGINSINPGLDGVLTYFSGHYIMRVDGAGKLVGKTEAKLASLINIYSQSYSQTDARRIVSDPDGGWMVVGSSRDAHGGPFRGYWARVNKTGTLLNGKYHSDMSGSFNDAVSVGGGYLVVGNKSAGATVYHSMLVRTDPLGKVIWERTHKLVPRTGMNRIFPNKDGSFRAVGNRQISGGWQVWLGGFNAEGSLLWQNTTTFPSSDSTPMSTAKAMPDGTIVVAGYSLLNGKYSPMLLRLDSWGRSSCTASGVCADKALEDCEDGNGCTAGSCDSVKGCVQAELADGTICAPGKVCKFISCK